MHNRQLAILGVFSTIFCLSASGQEEIGNPQNLKMKGDIASHLVAGVDKFLLREIKKAETSRPGKWKKEFRQSTNSKDFFDAKRQRFAKILGVRDRRVKASAPELMATIAIPALVAKSDTFEVYAIRLPVLDGLSMEGFWLSPINAKANSNVIVVPDADQTPESQIGLSDDLPATEQIARQLASQGHQVIVPTVISREMRKRNSRANLTHREYLYRSAFELGRHVIGYEIQKILAVVDWFEMSSPKQSIGIWGTGEGGMLALYAAAIDTRIDKVAVDDFVGGRSRNWEYPISRNVFGLLNDFGDAEVFSMVTPRPILHLHNSQGLTVSLPSEGGAPANLTPATKEEIDRVVQDYATSVANLELKPSLLTVMNRNTKLVQAIELFGQELDSGLPPKLNSSERAKENKSLPKLSLLVDTDPSSRMERQVKEMDRFNQKLLANSEAVRKVFMAKLDASSVKKFEHSVAAYREHFATEVIGRFDLPLKDFNVRARPYCEHEKYSGYEVVLDVFDDVIAYGIILVPKGMKSGERRPVVVCQHGLEGRPQDIVQGNHRAYHDFAAKLAEEGFITFSPQNLYIFRDRFRTLQRKANTIGKTLFSVIVPQHQQIVNWLKSLPNVDPKRIAFYGLSYGGKSAMRIPPLVPDYCLSICSADFNEWVWKNASTSSRYSYVWTGEYEIFEFDLGSTFNYAEMAALIAPRPFMVERGHFDGVSSDERVAYEFAKVRHLYQAKLKIGDRCEIEFFDGPHTINGKGTFRFLRKHLRWPGTH